MTNILQLGQRLEKLTNSPSVQHLDDISQIEFAKISISFGQVSDYIDFMDSTQASKLKTSDIALYQDKIQALLESINTSLSVIENKFNM